MSLLLLASCLLLRCPQIKLIEGELKQLTKLEVKRRNLDAENLQVGVTTFFLCLPKFTRFFFFFVYDYSIISCHCSIATTVYHCTY